MNKTIRLKKKCVHSEPTEVATRFEIVLLARSDETSNEDDVKTSDDVNETEGKITCQARSHINCIHNIGLPQ
jgi:hypothetical protein